VGIGVAAVAGQLSGHSQAASSLRGSAGGSGGSAGSTAPVAVSTTVARAIGSVPSTVIASVGQGASVVAMKSVTGPPMTTDGKPTVLFVGGEFCPYCAAERWAIFQALSRFGTLSGAGEITSSEGSVPTFEFARATYRSHYLSFSAVEVEDQQHQPLETLSPQQERIFTQYSPERSFPFLDVNGSFVQLGAGFDPGVLVGDTHEQIAAALADPTSPQSRGVVGEANVLTAAICAATLGAPADVCSNPAVAALRDSLTGTISG